MRRKCSRPNQHADDQLCFCLEHGRGVGVRQVLAQPFINGWVNERWMARAQRRLRDVEGDAMSNLTATITVETKRCWQCSRWWAHERGAGVVCPVFRIVPTTRDEVNAAATEAPMGGDMTKTVQIALAGNSVPPPLAEAIVRANFGRAGEVAA